LATRLLLLAPVLLFSIIAHEYAHGYAALKQGDTTAYERGRLTWNPLKHIDPVMSILLPLILWYAHGPILAGAKPVPVDPRRYRNVRRGDIIVSLAGVTANVAIALGCTVVVAVLGLLGRVAPAAADAIGILQAMALLGIGLNLVLAAFNLFPIPPLDGSHVVKYLLPPVWAARYERIGFLGIIILLLLLRTGLVELWLAPSMALTGWLEGGVSQLILPSAVRWLTPTRP
jgi:Zn-dependent protease